MQRPSEDREVEEMKTKLTIKGMHCESCKVLIEEVCNEMKGVKSCNVDVKAGKADIEHDETLDIKKLKKEIESLGEYKVTL